MSAVRHIRIDKIVNPKKNNTRPLSSRRKKISAQDDDNPFNLPDSTTIFSKQDEIEAENKNYFKKIQNMTLKDRALLGDENKKSHKSVRERIEARFKNDKTNDLEGIKPIYEIRTKQQHTNHMIQEQREIFLSNLLIDRHKKELERLKYIKNTKESNLENLETDVEEAQNRSKTIRAQLEMTRDRDRLLLEEQTKKRAEIETKVKHKRHEIDVLKAELTRLGDIHENYRDFDNVLKEISAMHGKRPETVQEFLSVFDMMENDGLFLISNTQNIQNRTERSDNSYATEIALVKQDIEELEAEIASLQNRKEQIQIITQSTPNCENIDKDLGEIQKMISNVYQRCFPNMNPSQSCITMLSLIEHHFEIMLKKFESIEDKEWVISKIKALSAQRRAALRTENLKKKERDQEEKKRQMIERATRPVKKRTGRPLVERVIVEKRKKKDVEETEAEILERERIEKLLFGDSIFD